MGGSNEIEEKQIPKEVYRAEYIDDTENVDLDDINPYSVLNISLQRNILGNLFSLQGKGGGEIFVIVYYDWSSYLTSVVNFLTPPQRSAGVLIRMSQSTTKIFPSSERMTFSSCKSLK